MTNLAYLFYCDECTHETMMPISVLDGRCYIVCEVCENKVALVYHLCKPYHLWKPITLDPDWLTPTVKTLAEQIYNDRAFERMPILADALEEAGCTVKEVLEHCRNGG